MSGEDSEIGTHHGTGKPARPETNRAATHATRAGRVRVTSVGTEADAPTATVTVKVIKPDGTDVAKTASVGFYARSAKLGDFVYADGSYSDILDEGKTCIGLCCYVDSVRSRRMAVWPWPIGRYPWGPKSAIVLADTSVQTVSVSGIPLTKQDNTTYKNWAGICKENVIDESQPDGRKRWANDKIFRWGYKTLDSDLMQFNAGDEIPLGQYETLCVIRTRNKVLTDENVNLPIPFAGSGLTESQNLNLQIASANNDPGNAYIYYYTLFSQAFAFEPTVKEGEVLADKFKAHHWFVPTPGDMAYWLYQLLTAKVFESQKMDLSISYGSNLMATTGQGGTDAKGDETCTWNAQTLSLETGTYSRSKSNFYALIPFVEF